MNAPRQPRELRLFNSLTRKVESFKPVHPGEARVYTCGPTVYNYPHIGNMRAYVFADVLGRTLDWCGFDLIHVINITDVGHLTGDGDTGEDKLEKAAAGSNATIWDIARHYTHAYWDDVKALNIRQPAHWSIATDYVPAMIDFAKSIAADHCYELESGLYFDTASVAHYGALARSVTEDGAEETRGRIAEVSGKRNAADFAIWRKTPAGESRQMEWNSPWGRGAPGWHLECSVMGEKLLGFPFDIHTGGIDHREIHHPNEIAQNQAFCGSDASGANIWMHNNFLVERREDGGPGKMSKSSGEFLRLQLLIDRGYHPLAYRMMCLQAHYRSELEFSWDGLRAALTRLKRLLIAAERVRDAGSGDAEDAKLQPFRERFAAAMQDDLNTPKALTALEDALAAKKVDAGAKRALIASMDDVLGLGLLTLARSDLRIRPKDAAADEAVLAEKLEARRKARAQKDFATSDALRDKLAAMGVEVMDGDPLEWEWKI
ncbi:cysteine--tRNA ligase [Altererythrobacter sp. SALINAS58]|uniref:cysteine--tRNA ligase n=1 Tax=Alteripontixanthobacter muriae TaxID=2705546 RepID=UPI001576A8EB|nr:cysteine--tRNA ligase [Alteripontixanthobacter muriae]NTZ42779.1 cysteine--tRNA ligase [Alteripontixanthobacter muriae]